MFKSKEAHFDGDYFFKEATFGTATVTSEDFIIGNIEAGIRVRGWVEGTATCSSGATITSTLQVSDDKVNWEDFAVQTKEATSTECTGEFFNIIPDTEKKFMRVALDNTGVTGDFTVAVEYIPR